MQLKDPTAPISVAPTTVTAHLQSQWKIDSEKLTSLERPENAQDALQMEVIQTTSQALSIYNEILGAIPYVSFTFQSETVGRDTSSKHVQVHLSRPNGAADSIAVHIVPQAEKGARYSDISTRAFGNINDNTAVANEESIGSHFSVDDAKSMLHLAECCFAALTKFRSNDIVLHNNPQGIQEWVNQPLGGFLDTGGQNKYVQCFARALGATKPTNRETPPSQIILNRSGPTQHEILAKSANSSIDGDTALRLGVHFFPDENVCLAFAPDSQPEKYLVKEQSHPRWERVDPNDLSSAKGDFVTVPDDSLRKYGISKGVYRMIDNGTMQDLAIGSSEILKYFKLDEQNDSGRKIAFANHYADAAYLSEFISRTLGTQFPSFFFMHSLGTFKADGLNYPDKLTNDIDAAASLEERLRITDRILGELWIVQKCKQSLIANSDGIASHAHKYLRAPHTPPTMIAVDEAAEGHISRQDRRNLALATFEKMHRMYLETCDNPILGEPVPTEQRLTLEQLMDAQIVYERSRHAEAESKGKWAVAKAMAIAMSAPESSAIGAPERVLMMNINLHALNEPDLKFRQEIVRIIADLQSVRANGGHIIIQPSFEYHFGFDICRVTDCYIALPAFEPFGMGVLEAAAAGAPVIARNDIPSVLEVLATEHRTTLQFPLRNSNQEVSISDGAILVGSDPIACNTDPQGYAKAAYSGAAAAINAITLGVSPVNKAIQFDPVVLGRQAARLVRDSSYNWKNVAREFLQQAFKD